MISTSHIGRSVASAYELRRSEPFPLPGPSRPGYDDLPAGAGPRPDGRSRLADAPAFAIAIDYPRLATASRAAEPVPSMGASDRVRTRDADPSPEPGTASQATASQEPGTASQEPATGASSAAEGPEGEGPEDAARPTGPGGQPLSDDEVRQVEDLEARDREVRAHEQAHKVAAGSYGGPIHYDYQTGPDAKRYAVGGHVPIDMSEVPGDPKATAEKMRTIRRAALAPAEPSSKDRQVAAEASRREMEARREATTQGDASASAGEAGPSPRGPASVSEGSSGPGIRVAQLRAAVRSAYGPPSDR